MRLFLNILILSILSLNCKAQSNTKSIKGKEFIYEIKSIANTDLIKIRNVQDTDITNKIKYDGDAKIDFNNNNEIKQLFVKIFDKNLLTEKFKNGSITVGFLIDKDGIIISLDFRMLESLLNYLKIENIEIFEKKIKQTINPKIINFNKDASYAYYTYVIKFNTL